MSAKTMKAVIYTAPNTVEVVEKEVPVPEEGEVVCKVGRRCLVLGKRGGLTACMAMVDQCERSLVRGRLVIAEQTADWTGSTAGVTCTRTVVTL